MLLLIFDFFYLHQVSVDNILLGQQPVFYLFLGHGRHQVELAKVLTEEAMHHRHIFFGHRPQTLSLRSLKERRKEIRRIKAVHEPCSLKSLASQTCVLSLTSGRRYNFMVRCIVMFLLKWENFTSISLRGFKERCQYLRKTSHL